MHPIEIRTQDFWNTAQGSYKVYQSGWLRLQREARVEHIPPDRWRFKTTQKRNFLEQFSVMRNGDKIEEALLAEVATTKQRLNGLITAIRSYRLAKQLQTVVAQKEPEQRKIKTRQRGGKPSVHTRLVELMGDGQPWKANDAFLALLTQDPTTSLIAVRVTLSRCNKTFERTDRGQYRLKLSQ